MTDQEKVFVECFLANGFNATRAAEVAGYGDPNANANRIRKQADISVEIESRLAQFGLTANEVLARIAAIASSDMTDFLQVEDGFATLDLKKAKEANQLHLLKSFNFSRKSGMKIELYDKLAALEKVGKALGMFTEKTEQSGKLTIEVNYSDATTQPDTA